MHRSNKNADRSECGRGINDCRPVRAEDDAGTVLRRQVLVKMKGMRNFKGSKCIDIGPAARRMDVPLALVCGWATGRQKHIGYEYSTVQYSTVHCISTG